MRKQADNPDFGFLKPDHPLHEYYVNMVRELGTVLHTRCHASAKNANKNANKIANKIANKNANKNAN